MARNKSHRKNPCKQKGYQRPAPEKLELPEKYGAVK